MRGFFWSVFSRIRTEYGEILHTPFLSVFSPNAEKYGPEKTAYLDTFHAVLKIQDSDSDSPLDSISRSSRLKEFLVKGVLKICSKFTGEYPCRSVISIKLLIEITIRHGFSTVHLLHNFRTAFSNNTSGWLLLQISRFTYSWRLKKVALLHNNFSKSSRFSLIEETMCS